jgi:hypothetical protein
MKKVITRINPSLISSLVMLIIIGTLLISISISFAWFSENKQAKATGMTISATDERVEFGPSVTIKRFIGDHVIEELEFRVPDDDPHSSQYYLWDSVSNAFVLENGERIPITIAGLLPGETVDLTFSYICTDSLEGRSLAIYFDRIIADTFNEMDGASTSHSVLGVYKISENQDDAGFSTPEWVVTSVSGTEDTTPTRVDIIDSTTWSTADVAAGIYKTVTVRLEFDLEQYTKLLTATNQLSEKGFSIGALRIEVLDND